MRGKLKKPTTTVRRMRILGTGPAAGAGAQEAIVVKLSGKKNIIKESSHTLEDNMTRRMIKAIKEINN